MLPSYLSFLFLSLVVALAAGSAADHGYISSFTTKHGSNSKYLILFGDSYTATAYNPDDHAQPSAQNVIGNPVYPGPTTSGGAIWAEILATNYSKGSNLIYNYASSGAVVNNSIIPPPGHGTPFDQQVNLGFNHITKNHAPRWPLKKSVIAVWFGQNDVFQGVVVRRDPNSIYSEVMDCMFAYCDRIYKEGARNFLFIKVAPIEKTPFVIQNYTAETSGLTNATAAYNQQLDSHAKDFGARHRDATYHVFDPTPSFNRVLNSPRQNGAPDATCSNENGRSCLWWNNYHPGIAIHEAIAADIAIANYFPDFFTTG